MKNERPKVAKLFMPRIIRRYRDAAGLSQQDLADYLDVSKGFVSALEGGRSTPSIDMLLAIARACDVRPGELLDALVEEVKKKSLLKKM